MEENKSCYNCRYFYQHYIIHLKGIRPLECGHCSRQKIKAKELSKFPFRVGCEFWEYKEDSDRSRKSIVDALNKMEKEIHEILLILKLNESKISK